MTTNPANDATWLDGPSVRQRMIQRAELLGSQKALAGELGISSSYLSDVLKGRRDISFELARKMGLRKEERFWNETQSADK